MQISPVRRKNHRPFRPEKVGGSKPRVLPLLWLALAAIAFQAPFLGQAFHIDDNLYLMVARNWENSPWFPQDLTTYFEGLRVDQFAGHSHPLVLSSLLLRPALSATWVSTEVAARAIFFPFYLVLIFSTFVLARRVTSKPEVAALLTALSPAVFLSSHTVMLDVPFTSLIYLSLAIVATRRFGTTLVHAVTGLLMGFSAMLAYQALVFLPAILYTPDSRRSKHLVWGIPLVTTLAYGLVNLAYFGKLGLDDMAAFVYQTPTAGGGVGAKVFSGMLTLLAAIFFPPLWLALLKRRKVTGSGKGDRVVGQLKLVVVCNVVLFLVGYYVAAVRYWVPATPALIILVVRALETRWASEQLRTLLMGAVIWTGALSLFLACADYEWSAFYRKTSELVSEYQDNDHRVWFTGEWGFRWYLTEMGAEVLGRADNRPRVGDVLFRPRVASPYATIFDGHPGALQVERIIEFVPSTRFRILDMRSGAGFYSFAWGLLPYSMTFEKEPVEVIAIYRFMKALPKPDREPTYWEWNRPSRIGDS